MPDPSYWTAGHAQAILRKEYGISGQVQDLPSYDDRNFLVIAPDGRRFVLKISLRDRAVGEIDFIIQLMQQLAGLPVPQMQPTLTGSLRLALDGGAQARLITHLPGTLLARVRPHPPALLRDLGRVLAEIDRRLADYSHPAMRRHLDWDLGRAGEIIAARIDILPDAARREQVEKVLERFENRVQPRLADLPAQVIYNDANDQNILVEGGRVSGIFDFGDALYAPRVFDPVIAAAYAMFAKSDPLEAGVEVVRGYHAANPLQAPEVDLIFDLVRTRLAASVCLAAERARSEPHSAYHQSSTPHAWEVLEKLDSVHPEFGRAVFRAACGLAPSQKGAQLADWLGASTGEYGRVVAGDQVTRIDLSVGSRLLPGLDLLDDPRALEEHIFSALARDGGHPGAGGYGEPRLIYTGGMFEIERNQRIERRSVHLGVDLWAPPGTPVRAPLAGRVHAWSDQRGHQDYGPVIVLAHPIGVEDGSGEGPRTFYTLYGHLSRDSLEGLADGMPIARGQVLGRIGETAVNGGWPPHLHFQVIADLLGLGTHFPGVALPSQREIYQSLCPDPNLILGYPNLAPPAVPETALLETRRARLGPSLSLSYESPLHIVRGWRQYLYDGDGQPYLDCVNNVCHVGHSHPQVVAAIAGQAAVLNTNTRYLHANILQLAERLAERMPAPLSVCYFVNSGSEANDLALRLARAYTGGWDMLVLEGAYHGNLSTTVDLSPYKHDGPGGQGAPVWVHSLPMPCAYRGALRGLADPARGYAQQAADALAQIHAAGRRPAGFLSESILGTGGQVVFPPGYLAQVYARVRAAGGVCIADEVQHGFGRVGAHYWGFELHGVAPDIVTMGKPFGNGHPLAAVVTRPEIAAAFDNGMEYFNTFGGNPVSAAAGLAVMEVIEKEELQSHALALGRLWRAELEGLKLKHELIGDVRGAGLFLGIELVADRETLEPAPREAAWIVEMLRQGGILLSTDGPLHNVIKIKPPLVIQETDVLRVTANLDAALESLARGGQV